MVPQIIAGQGGKADKGFLVLKEEPIEDGGTVFVSLEQLRTEKRGSVERSIYPHPLWPILVGVAFVVGLIVGMMLEAWA